MEKEHLTLDEVMKLADLVKRWIIFEQPLEGAYKLVGSIGYNQFDYPKEGIEAELQVEIIKFGGEDYHFMVKNESDILGDYFVEKNPEVSKLCQRLKREYDEWSVKRHNQKVEQARGVSTWKET